MRAMEIGEIKKSKKELEKKIRDLLVEFQNETGTRVSVLTLDIHKHYDCAHTDIDRSEILGVNLHVEI
jgi:hypothetical protein